MGKERKQFSNLTQVSSAVGAVTTEAKQVKGDDTGPAELVTLYWSPFRVMSGQKMHTDQYKPTLYPEQRARGRNTELME